MRGPEHASEVDAALSRGAENLGRCRDVIAALGKRFDYLAEPLGRIKHLAAKTRWIQQLVAKKALDIEPVGGEFNESDLGTKLLPRARLEWLREQVGLVPMPTPTAPSSWQLRSPTSTAMSRKR